MGFVGMSYLLGGFCVLLVTLFIFLQVFYKVKNIGRTESEAGIAAKKNKTEDICPFQDQTLPLVSICLTSWEESYRHHLIEALLRDHRNTTV